MSSLWTRFGAPPSDSRITPQDWPVRSVRVARSPSPSRSMVTPCSSSELAELPDMCRVSSPAAPAPPAALMVPSARKTAPSLVSCVVCVARA